jgi:hypothetical protein
MTNATILPRSTALRFARTAALSLLLAALAACGDDPAGPGDGPSSIHFSFRGSGPERTVEGIYEVDGDPVLAGTQITQTFAIGQRVSGESTLRVLTNWFHPAQGTADFAWVTVPRLTVGTVAIDGVCPGETCAGVTLALEVQTGAVFDQAKYSCDLYDGTVRINSISSGRATGTFSGTGRCTGQPGTADLDEFRITGGTFDVNVIDVAS